MSQKGLNYAKDIGLKVIRREIQNLNIPDQHGSSGTPIGSVEYWVKEIKVHRLEIPRGGISVQQGNGLNLNLDQIRAHISFRWRYKKKKWPRISGSGGGNCEAGNSIVGLQIRLNPVNGKIHVSIPNAHMILNSFKLKLSGGAAWLLNLLVGLFKNKIRKEIEKGIRNALLKTVAGKANQELNKIPYSVRLPGKFGLGIDYKMTAAPIYGNGFINVPIKGELYDANNRQPSPIQPDASPNTLPGDKMLFLIITNYLPLTAGDIFHKKGILKLEINDKMVPPSSPIRLNTRAFILLIPALQIKFPDHELVVKIFSTRHPDLGFTQEGKVVKFHCEMVFYAVDPKTKQEKYAFTLEGSFDAKAIVKLQGNDKVQKLIPELKFLQQAFKLKKSEIGTFTVEPLNYIFNFAFNNGIIPYINHFVKDGFPIPTIPDGKLINPEIKFESKYLSVSTDIEYNLKTLGVNEKVELVSK
eukprot:gene10705-3327_t